MEKNMNVNGVGTITKGSYGNVSINGTGNIVGDVKAINVDVAGLSKGEGTLSSDKISISGCMKYEGDIKVSETFNISGYSKIIGALDAEKIEIAGYLKVSKKVVFNKIEVDGRFICTKDCEGEIFECNGETKISGLLSADNINICISKNSKIDEIGGENIDIKADNLKLISKILGCKLESNLIEGDKIYLENTVAKKVNGKNIVIGKNCVIDTVNYSGSLDINKNGIVKNQNHIGEERE